MPASSQKEGQQRYGRGSVTEMLRKWNQHDFLTQLVVLGGERRARRGGGRGEGERGGRTAPVRPPLLSWDTWVYDGISSRMRDT